MEGLSRLQLALCAAVGVALLLLGVRAMGAEEEGSSAERRERQPAVRLSSAGGAGSGDLLVHVTGAVVDPGVYRLPAGSRVEDAVERAGGAKRSGDPDSINLAAPLGDGQQIVVPARAGADTASAGTVASSADGPISLGAADQADLETIDGIGPVTAADIIAFRDERGGISSVDELDQIPGIGPATIEALSERLQP